MLNVKFIWVLADRMLVVVVITMQQNNGKLAFGSWKQSSNTARIVVVYYCFW